MINIGEKLRSIRLDKGISSKELEALSGINQSTISRIENNTHSPSIETLFKICSALEISINDFFKDNEELPVDLMSLLNTAKKMSPTQRQKVTEMIESFLLKN